MKFFTLLFTFFLVLAQSSYCEITFVANINKSWDLFVTNENGQNTIQLTRTDYDEKDPFWSSNKKNIVYSTSDGQLNIIDTDTKKHIKLLK